jgi:hypothetical protein
VDSKRKKLLHKELRELMQRNRGNWNKKEIGRKKIERRVCKEVELLPKKSV